MFVCAVQHILTPKSNRRKHKETLPAIQPPAPSPNLDFLTLYTAQKGGAFISDG